ncbi:hypothetical protein GCM10012288_20120 [Malaciobacter pacificus]|jgi:hypothetical protein|uniref:Uncharacterized protein n=1 Tax=Malaciobacter pacificus TaxID=1080223 RepID=A0A5C2HBW3_9BACT|nr:hypothetical protein [Malaciobacter pacificus]QEP34274.1 hypothetical protein APAC_1152 [Malaciobacter pacificus]GGD45764.1 hypothetical protein GCM10012288_20120 [Malaciobacter pacificus]
MKKILPLIIIVVFSVIFYAIYKESTKSLKIKRLACQAKTTTFERVFAQGPVKEGIDALLNKNYIIKSNIEYSKYMKSNIKQSVYIEDLDRLLTSVIDRYAKPTDSTDTKKVLIEYYLYENDKEDKGKNNDKAKEYAGYLMFDFKYDNKLIYKIQTDYSFVDTRDVEERMECAINSFISLKGK